MELQNISPASEERAASSPVKRKWTPRGSTESVEDAQLRFPKRGQWRKKDLTGRRFGRLVVASESGRTKNQKITWNCLCDCGNKTIAIGADMLCGKQVSCGCQRNEASHRNGLLSRKHGLSFTRIASTRKGIIQRCLNADNKDYPKYGGRGIRVCEAIKTTPAKILDILGEKPDGMSIDRINNNGNYSCGDCRECSENSWTMNIRWATPIQQSRNSRINRLIEIDGVARCMVEWCELSGISRTVMAYRLKRNVRGQALLAPSKTILNK